MFSFLLDRAECDSDTWVEKNAFVYKADFNCQNHTIEYPECQNPIKRTEIKKVHSERKNTVRPYVHGQVFCAIVGQEHRFDCEESRTCIRKWKQGECTDEEKEENRTLGRSASGACRCRDTAAA